MHWLNNRFNPLLVTLLLIITLDTFGCNTSMPPKILASIKPLQLIAHAITHSVSNADVLLPCGASPHSYSLKPSDRVRLDAADIVFWIGPELETFLSTVLEKSKNKKSLSMMSAIGTFQRKEQNKHNGEEHNCCHHGDYDPHIWLSPKNALAMARVINDQLQSADKDEKNREKYKANLFAFEIAIGKSDQQNTNLLKEVRKKPFFVFHDAYGYLQDHYGLNIAGYFIISPQKQPGIRRLEELRKQLKDAGPTSVFREPQFQSSFINRLTDGLPIKVGVLDPLASDVAITPDGYITFINSLISNIHDSLISH